MSIAICFIILSRNERILFLHKMLGIQLTDTAVIQNTTIISQRFQNITCAIILRCRFTFYRLLQTRPICVYITHIFLTLIMLMDVDM
jgi:hypothetical protein